MNIKNVSSARVHILVLKIRLFGQKNLPKFQHLSDAAAPNQLQLIYFTEIDETRKHFWNNPSITQNIKTQVKNN